MTALKITGFILAIALLAGSLIGCSEPDALEVEADEEIIEEVEAAEEEKDEDKLEGNDTEGNQDNSYTGPSSSDSGFTHTVDMKINGEVKEGEGEEWWKD